MKKLFMLPALFALAVTGCGGDDPAPSGDVGWAQDVKEEMTEYLGLVLPFVQFDTATLYHSWDEAESAYFIGDDSETNVLDGYGDRLLRTGWTPVTEEGSVNYTKSTEVGDLTLHAEWYEATDLYPCGNKIAVYVEGQGGGGDDPFAGTYTFKMADMGWADQLENPSVVAEPGLTIITDPGENTKDTGIPKYYNNGASIRLYALNTLTLSADKITEIKFTFTSVTDSQTMTPDEGSFTAWSNEGATWKGDASEIVFTLGTKGQVRISEMVVTGTFSGGGVTPVDPPVPTGDYTPTSVMQDLDKWAWPDEWEESDINAPDEDGLVTCEYAMVYDDAGLEDTQECLEDMLTIALSQENFPSYLVQNSEMGYANNEAYVFFATIDYSVAVLFYDYYYDGEVYVWFEAAPYDYYE